MSGLACLLVVAAATGAAFVAHWLLDRSEQRPEFADTRRPDLAPDTDTGPDLRYAAYPPGSLGGYPDGLPAAPGRMGAGDSAAAVAEAVRIARDAAEAQR